MEVGLKHFYFATFLFPKKEQFVTRCVAGGEIDVVNLKRRLDVNWETGEILD